MALELAGIKGTITVGLDGQDQTELATFEVPVTASFDGDGMATLHAVPHDTIVKAMVAALTEAASRLLESLPDAEVTTEHMSTLITCATCGEQIAWRDSKASLIHADGGAHIFEPRYA